MSSLSMECWKCANKLVQEMVKININEVLKQAPMILQQKFVNISISNSHSTHSNTAVQRKKKKKKNPHQFIPKPFFFQLINFPIHKFNLSFWFLKR